MKKDTVKAKEFIKKYKKNGSTFKDIKTIVKNVQRLLDKKENELEIEKFIISELISNDQNFDIKALAKCDIVWLSSSIENNNLLKLSREFQEKVFNLSEKDFYELEAFYNDGLNIENRNKIAALLNFNFQENNGWAQNINIIINNAIKNYNGVKVKCDNYNKKYKDQILNGKKIKKEAFNSDGFLNEKPGINNTFYCVQQNTNNIFLKLSEIPLGFEGAMLRLHRLL